MKKRDTYMHRSIATLAIAIIALVAMGTVGGCSLLRGQPEINLRDYYVSIETGRNASGSSDTLYATVEDSVLISVYSRPHSSVFTRPRAVDIEHYAIDFGDGTQSSDPKWTTSKIEPKHLYKKKGVYQLRVWGSYNDMTLCADTVHVVVQDYVYPIEATKINISVTGIQRNFFHTIERPGQRDSTYLTTEKDFAYSIDTTGDIEFTWDAIQGLYIQEFKGMHPNGQKRMSNLGNWQFLADGSALQAVYLSRTEHTPLENSTREVQTNISFRHLPLKKGTSPTRQHAVYEASYPVDTQNPFTRWAGYAREMANHSYKIQSGDTTHSAKTIHASAYSDITITVEFTTE